MYLSNNDIKKIIEEMEFETPNPDLPFDASEQIQVCSIDLRLSTEFWRQKKVRYPIDLHKSKLAELSPRRHWKKITLSPTQSITLKPNEFVLGHTYEKFTIPSSHAGKVNTRSSFARLGIETNSATDFMNPGWKGHLPLEIVNKSINSIKLYPYMSVVQIMLIPLTSIPDKNYGDDSLASKYQNDDGGPSRWWRDKLYDRYQESLSNEMLDNLIEKFKEINDSGLYRFEKYFEGLENHQIDNAQNLLELFSKRERTRLVVQNFLLWFFPLIQAALLGLSLKLFFNETIKPSYWFVWALAIIWLVPTILYLFVRERKIFYDKL